MTQSARDWCFTNFYECDYNAILNNNEHCVKYLVWQTEQCPETGKKHHQCYIELDKKQRFSYIQKLFGNSFHCEKRKGTREEARNYCMKKDTRIDGPFEWGEFKPTQQGKRNDIEAIYEATKSGASNEEISEAYPVAYMKYYKAVDRLRHDICESKGKQRRTELQTTVIYGPAGSGKTRWIYDNIKTEDIYKLDLNGGSRTWYDGYTGQRVLVIDDFYGNLMEWSELLRTLDIYPLRLQTKGSFTYACWEEIYITSNVHPNEWYCNKGFPIELSRRLHIIRSTESDITSVYDPESKQRFDIMIQEFTEEQEGPDTDNEKLTTEVRKDMIEINNVPVVGGGNTSSPSTITNTNDLDMHEMLNEDLPILEEEEIIDEQMIEFIYTALPTVEENNIALPTIVENKRKSAKQKLHNRMQTLKNKRTRK